MPEVIALFWVIKILTTAGGEVTSDYLATLRQHRSAAAWARRASASALLLQSRTRRYRAFAYWFFAFSIAIFGTASPTSCTSTSASPYAGTTRAVGGHAGAVFVALAPHRGHAVDPQHHDAAPRVFYWCTVFATFALGTALGDYTADALHLGFLGSGILFGVVILDPGAAAWRLRLERGASRSGCPMC